MIVCDITNLGKAQRSFFDGTPAARRIVVEPRMTLIGVTLGEHVVLLLRQSGLLIREIQQMDPACPRRLPKAVAA